MPRPVRHADLVARALDALAGPERARVDAALEADPGLRRRFEEVAGHLLQYDRLPPAPPPPAYARLAAALDDDAAPDLRVLRLQRPEGARRRGLLGNVALAAAAVVVGLLLYRPWGSDREGGLYVVPGEGMELVRAGGAVPAPAQARVPARSGDVLRCAQAAEVRFGDRVRVVLDGGAALRVEAEDALALERGRAWFEVAPGAFEVRTIHGPVRVVGTAFEVDLRSGTLEVAVAQGWVIAGGHEILAEERLLHGRVGLDALGAGAWFRRPALHLSDGGAPHALGRPLELRLGFRNPGRVPLVVPGPAAARTALWLSFEAPDGRVLGELPVLEANVTAGREVLQPGGSLELAPGSQHVLALKILPPFGSPGAYRCRALYRPAGQPGVLSTTLELEVR